MSLFAWQVTWTDCIVIGAIDLVWFVIVMLLRHYRLRQGLQDVDCVLCRVMSCCSQCEWQKYDWRERLWSGHSIWGQRNGETYFLITISPLLPHFILCSILLIDWRYHECSAVSSWQVFALNSCPPLQVRLCITQHSFFWNEITGPHFSLSHASYCSFVVSWDVLDWTRPWLTTYYNAR